MSLLPGRFYLDDFFDDLDSDKKVMNMNCDIYEKEGKCNILVEAPGFNKKDIKMSVNNGYLTIEATRKENNDEKDKHYIKKERFYGSCKRSFYIGDVNTEEITAKFEDGILHIEVPKENKENGKKYIDIK